MSTIHLFSLTEVCIHQNRLSTSPSFQDSFTPQNRHSNKSISGGGSTSTRTDGDGTALRASIHTNEYEQPGNGAEWSVQVRAGGRDVSTSTRAETVLGKEHPFTLVSMNNLALLLKCSFQVTLEPPPPRRRLSH